MSAFIRYQLINFVRSLKFIPPAVVFLAWIIILYAYNNAPILSSFGVSSIALYLVMTWMTMALFALEEESEKLILFTYLGSKNKYLAGKWMTAMAMMVPLLLFSIFFPIVTESFKGDMSLKLYSFTFYSHLVFSALGILVGTLFSATRLATKKYAWLSAVFVIIVSLASKSLIETVPFLKIMLWVFPPVFKIIGHMGGGDVLFMKESILIHVVFVIGYIIIGGVITIILFRKKES